MKLKGNEENLFEIDKKIQEAYKLLLKKMNKLPEIERSRIKIRV